MELLINPFNISSDSLDFDPKFISDLFVQEPFRKEL